MSFAFDDLEAQALVGSSASITLVVTDADTATALGSGDLEVLATPRLVALMEAAALRLVAGCIPGTCTSVGSRIDLRHRAPSPIGTEVTAFAQVNEVVGSRVTFEVWATHARSGGIVEIGRGTHVRVVVDRVGFA